MSSKIQIYVSNVGEEEIERALVDFCTNYNEETKLVFPILNILGTKEFLVTFKKEISFDIMSYLVNYLQYPFEIKYEPEITGWTTITPSETWIDKELFNKEVMLYISENDDEFDNIYFTTKSNKTYKNSFSQEKITETENEKRPYEDIESLVGRKKIIRTNFLFTETE